MSISPARRIAFAILQRVETGRAYASDLLHAHLSAAGRRVKREDAALATELVLGVLRWQRLLDFLLQQHLEKPLARLDPEVLVALRLGLYQMRFLTRVPARAAVHEAVELVKRARKSSAARLVNLVLRKEALRAGKPAERALPPDLPAVERFAILHSHPTWMVARWIARFGEDGAKALLEVNNRPPRLTCAVLDPGQASAAAVALRQAGLSVEPGRLLRSAWTLRGGSPSGTEAFRRGWINVQDEASQMVAFLLGVEPGQAVLDSCAAPGGKTALLARAAGGDGRVVAADLHLHRLRAMRASLSRVAAPHVLLLAADATRPLPLNRQFDRILVDPPCSGTGTLARNPEIRWRLRQEDLSDFHGRQVALLSQTLELLAPGGRLVYSTCSLEPEENEDVVAEVLGRCAGIRIVRDACALAPHLAEGVVVEQFFGRDGYFRTSPVHHCTDGFFAAILERPDG